MKPMRSRWLAIFIAYSCFALLATMPALANVLDEYVAKPDAAYAWTLSQKNPLPGGATLYQLNLTSQVWQGTNWRHRLYVIMPAGTPKHNTALLYIAGSGSGANELSFMSGLAHQLSAPVATVFDIPNQPLFGGLNEDALISYTFAKFFETGDTSWPLLLPMTKGAVKAMDAVTEFVGTLGSSVDGFLVFGGSKRGWTTWLAAAVDQRVKAIAPIAYDNLALSKQMAHQLTRFGNYSQQIDDYTSRSLQQLLPTARGQQLAGIVDPYAYIERFTIPKLLIRGANDPYWPVDAVQLYLNDLPGDTWLHYDPNAGHGLANLQKVLATVGGFYLHTVGDLSLQPIRWEYHQTDEGIILQVQGQGQAASINLWSAIDVTSTDFRQSIWRVEATGPGQAHTFKVPYQTGGNIALYGEIAYQVNDTPVVFDTPVFVIEPRK